MKALILAAGYATRLYPLTKDRPKALLEVSGRAILDYIIDEVETIDAINEAVIISNDKYFSEFNKWAELKQPSLRNKLTVLNDCTTSEHDRLGAIKDMWFAINELSIDEDIVVIAGDNLFTYSLLDSYNVFMKHRKDLILAKSIPTVEELQRMAVGLLDENNIIIDMEEKPKNPKSDIAFFATYFYLRDTLPQIRAYLEEGNPPDAPGHFPAWLYVRKPVMAHLFNGDCYDIGTHESYEFVKKNFKSASK